MGTHLAARSDKLGRFFAVASAVAVASLLAACSSGAGSPASASPPSASGGPTLGAPSRAPGSDAGTSEIAVAPGVPAATAVGGSGGAAGTGSASAPAGAAIAYPYVGSSGVAPDHSIVVAGAGSAALNADGSNRSTAVRLALNAAMADARGQAEIVAAAAHVTIEGVLSVSSNVSPIVVYPMGVATPSKGSSSPGALPPTIAGPEGPTQLSASVTVAYTIR